LPHKRPPGVASAIVTAGLMLAAGATHADDVLHRYEADVVPDDPSTGWLLFDRCEQTCSSYSADSRFILEWTQVELVNYHLWIARAGEPRPATLWAEWRFRSNVPRPRGDYGCDGRFSVTYRNIVQLLYLHGDSAVSFSGDDVLSGLELNGFHTFRFESLDGTNYRFYADGKTVTAGHSTGDVGLDYIQFGGDGSCANPNDPIRRNEWDYVRWGTIGYGESIIATDPPGPTTGGFIDARTHPALDRFTVTYDQPNYVYVDEIAVAASEPRAQARGPSSVPNVTGLAPGALTTFAPPTVTATRRQDNGPPETVEIVLDRPIPYNATTRFTFNDGTSEQTVELTYAPGDTDGDGDADLADFAALQNCFGQPAAPGVCASLDRDRDAEITDTDFTAFYSAFWDW